MCVNKYLCVHIYRHICTYIFVYIYIYTWTHIFTCIYIYTHIYIHKKRIAPPEDKWMFLWITYRCYTYKHTYINTLIHIYIHIYMYIETNMYIHIHVKKKNRPVFYEDMIDAFPPTDVLETVTILNRVSRIPQALTCDMAHSCMELCTT